MNYREKLNKIVYLYSTTEPKDAVALAGIENTMKRLYPGPYTLRWTEGYDVEMIWEDPAEASFYALTWN